MRKLGFLAVLIVALSLTSWASSGVGLQGFHGKIEHGSGAGLSKVFVSSFSDHHESQGGLRFDRSESDGGKFHGGSPKFNSHRHSDDDGGDDDGGEVALPVPEPGTLSMLGAGLVALAGVVRRRSNV